MDGKDKFGRTMHKVTCSECGKETEVPFEPDGKRPVYCRDCFMKKKGRSFSDRGPRREWKPAVDSKPKEKEAEDEPEEEFEESEDEE